MKFCLNKKKFMVNIIKKINNICYFDKIIINGFNYNLEKKIILIQRNIKNFLKTKNNNYKIKTNNKYLSSNNAFQSTNEISNKKNEQNEPNNINTISEFNLYENSFISNNVNAMSFDFKDIQNENIEDDDNNIINTKKESPIVVDNERNNEIKVLKNNKAVYVISYLLNSPSASKKLKQLNKITFIGKSKRSSKFRGVSKNGNQWQVLLMYKKGKSYVGSYSNEEFAARIYDILAIKLRGVKARTNFKYSYEQIKKIGDNDFDIKSKNINDIIAQFV